MNTIVPYAINPSSFSSSNTVVLSSITIQFALEAMDKEAAYTKLQDLVWILEVLTAHNICKIVMQLKASQNSLNSYF
jgi:hypothetical protein